VNVQILKYPLGYGLNSVPAGKILEVGIQHGNLTVWIEVQENRVDFQNLEVKATGEGFNAAGLKHVGTAVSDLFVWHVYKRGN